MLKTVLKLGVVATMMLSSQAFAWGSWGNPCSLLGDHALMFAQWRNSGQPHSEVDKYFSGQSDSKLIRMERAIAEDIYSKPVDTLSPGAWQAMAIKVCEDQYGR